MLRQVIPQHSFQCGRHWKDRRGILRFWLPYLPSVVEVVFGQRQEFPARKPVVQARANIVLYGSLAAAIILAA